MDERNHDAMIFIKILLAAFNGINRTWPGTAARYAPSAYRSLKQQRRPITRLYDAVRLAIITRDKPGYMFASLMTVLGIVWVSLQRWRALPAIITTARRHGVAVAGIYGTERRVSGWTPMSSRRIPATIMRAMMCNRDVPTLMYRRYYLPAIDVGSRREWSAGTEVSIWAVKLTIDHQHHGAYVPRLNCGR